MTLDFALSLTLFRVFAVAGAVSTASFVASLAACNVSPAVFVVSFTALTVSLIIPRSFRSLTVSLISFAVSRIAVVVSCIALASSPIVPQYLWLHFLSILQLDQMYLNNRVFSLNYH